MLCKVTHCAGRVHLYTDVCNICTIDSIHSANHTYFHPIYFTFTLWATFSEGASKSIGPKRRVESSCQRMKISFLVSCLSNHHFPASFVILGSPYTTNDLSRYNCNLTIRTAVPFTAATQFSALYFQPTKLIGQATSSRVRGKYKMYAVCTHAHAAACTTSN